MSIQAIETEYKGYKFRSRLEARWAVFFDAMNVKWEYEKEGFENERGEKYLPDFYLPEHDIWCEVKPFDRSRKREIEKDCYVVSDDLKIRALILLPNIPEETYHNSLFWYRCAHYDTLERDVTISRVMFDTEKYWKTGQERFSIVCDDPIGRYRHVEYPSTLFEWMCVHDFDMPYDSDGVFGGKVCLHVDKRTPELDEAYKKARQARFSNAKIS